MQRERRVLRRTPPLGPLARLEPLLPAAALLVLAIVVYGGYVLHGGWYLDDWPLIVQLDQADGAGDVLSTAQSYSHRPAYGPWFAAMYAVGGTGQAPYHLVTLLITAAQGVLLHAVLRRVGVRQGIALTAAALLVVLPNIDAARLWLAATAANTALTLVLAGTLVALHGATARTRLRRVAGHAAGLVLALVGVCTYELVAPLVPLGTLLVWRVASLRPMLGRLAVDAAATAATVLWLASRAERFRAVERDLGQILGRIGEVWPSSVEAFFSVLPAGEALRGWPGLVLLALVTAGAVIAHRRDPAAARPVLAAAVISAAGLVGALAGLVMLLPADSYYAPRPTGLGNRSGAAAAPGLVVLVVGLVWLTALALAALVRRPALGPPAAVAVSLLTIVVLAEREVRQQDAWQDAWVQAQRVVSAVRASTNCELPPRTGIVTFGHTTNLLPADVPVFAAGWDLRFAVQHACSDPTLDGHPAMPGVRCTPEGVAVQSPDRVFPYSRLVAVDAGAYTARRVRTPSECAQLALD